MNIALTEDIVSIFTNGIKILPHSHCINDEAYLLVSYENFSKISKLNESKLVTQNEVDQWGNNEESW